MMPRLRPFLLLSALLAAAACGDRSITTPVASAGTSAALFSKAGQFGSASGPGDVEILRRSKPLKDAVTTSGIIGPNGGTLSIHEAGLEVEFDAGAVKVPTRITVTASKGKDVAYEFQPHGLKFLAPVVIRQDLKNTSAESDGLLALSLQGSYFEGSLEANRIGTSGRFVHIKEGRKARLSSAGRFLEFSIEHFSGWMMSTGIISIDIEAR